MKVVNWISNDDIVENNYKDNDLGGLGGWFNGHLIHNKNEKIENNTFEDYLNEFKDYKIYIVALKESILKNNIRFGGNYHQNAANGIPLFEDGTYSIFSFRAWGDLMAAIYTTKEEPLTYMGYYY